MLVRRFFLMVPMIVRGLLVSGAAYFAVVGAVHAQATAGYTVKPGDTLEISVWKEPDLQRTVLVRPDGAF
ncbi:MAG: polysaccharide biosynthesis/export family protein, partial [Steroidobacteraceae bacterium]